MRRSFLNSTKTVGSRVENASVDWYLNLSYDITLRRVNDEFLLIIQELSMVVRGADLTALYVEIENRKRAYFSGMIDAGRANQIHLPTDYTSRKTLIRSVTPFTIKIAIVILAIVFGALALGSMAEIKLNDLRKVARNIGKDIPRSIEEGLMDLRAMSPEKQQRVLTSVRNYLDSIAPVLQEINQALHSSSIESTPKEKQPYAHE